MALYHKNSLGPLAMTYEHLQGIDVIDRCLSSHSTNAGSHETLLKVIFQSAELIIWHLENLTARITHDINNEQYSKSVTKIHWLYSFHQLLFNISTVLINLGMSFNKVPKSKLSISSSPAFKQYFKTLCQFDSVVNTKIDLKKIDINHILENETVGNSLFDLIHHIRLCAHESTIWEDNLSNIALSFTIPSYESFVLSDCIKSLVFQRNLEGDTFFNQFRALHQIPEIIAREITRRCHKILTNIKNKKFKPVVEDFNVINALFQIMTISLNPMIEHLATSDYHQFRENLGLASGSHSICIRYRIFLASCEKFWLSLLPIIASYTQCNVDLEQDIIRAVRHIDSKKNTNELYWELHLIFNALITFHKQIKTWRDQHIHLVRNNIGAGDIKSVTGFIDALTVAKNFGSKPMKKTVIKPLLRARSIEYFNDNLNTHPLAQYHASNDAIDRKIALSCGSITKKHFQNVQDREGFFSQKCPFKHPSRNEIDSYFD